MPEARKYPFGFKNCPDGRAQPDDDVRHNIGADDVILSADFIGQIALDKVGAVFHPIEAGVFPGDFGGQLVDVYPVGVGRAQQHAADGENAAAAANVEHSAAGRDRLLQKFHAKAGWWHGCRFRKPCPDPA